MPDREEIDRFFGDPGFAGSAHPSSSPTPDSAVTRTRTHDPSSNAPAEPRFVVEVTYSDGNPLAVFRSSDALEAFKRAAYELEEEKIAGRGGTSVSVTVCDSENPELGRFHAHDYDGWLYLCGDEVERREP